MKKTLICLLACCFALQVSAQKANFGANLKAPASLEDKKEFTEKLPAPKMKESMPLMETLRRRETKRDFLPERLSMQELSNLLWAANGINRPKEGKRTAPSARNAQEIDVYVFLPEGVFFYNPEKHYLEMLHKEDMRDKVSRQKFFKVAPVVLVFVANFDKMENFDEQARDFYSATDVGYVSQNVYLYCAGSQRLGTVACGSIERDFLRDVLHVGNGKALLAQPVGYTSNKE